MGVNGTAVCAEGDSDACRVMQKFSGQFRHFVLRLLDAVPRLRGFCRLVDYGQRCCVNISALELRLGKCTLNTKYYGKECDCAGSDLLFHYILVLGIVLNKVSENLRLAKKLLNYFWNVDKIGYLCTTFKGYSTTESWVSG